MARTFIASLVGLMEEEDYRIALLCYSEMIVIITLSCYTSTRARVGEIDYRTRHVIFFRLEQIYPHI